MKILTPADYIQQPWANGRGTTTELLRIGTDPLLVLLSMAVVTEDGPFSLFPGIERNLTVLTGPGFRLQGDGLALDCTPLRPVAFAGDVAIRAVGTEGQPSTDFNVMTARSLPRPQVVAAGPGAEMPAGGLLALFALEPCRLSEARLGLHDLAITDGPVSVIAGRVLAIRLFGVAI